MIFGVCEDTHVPEDTTPSGASGPPSHRGSLWRDRNFLTVWGGQALSQFGAQIVELAIPVFAVLILQASEAEVGFLNAAATAAFLIVGLPAGAWIDRMRKRRVMIWADAVRALALAAIPTLFLLDVLQMWHLYVVALIIGVATVFFDVAYQSLVPSLVRPDQIADANGKFETTQQLAGLSGPAIGGWLIGLISAPLAVVVTVVTYVASFVALLFAKDAEVPRDVADRAPLHREISEGLRWVFGNALLRRIVACTALSNFASTIIFTLTGIYFLRIIGLTPAQMGLVFSFGAAGGLIGATVTARLAARLGEGRLIPLSAIVFTVGLLPTPLAVLLPPTGAFILLAASTALGSFGVLVYNITQVTFRQRITPTRLLGRMNASIRFCVWGVMPIGALVAGWLGSVLGTVPTLWVGTAIAVVSVLPMVIGPFWAIRALPDAAEPRDTTA